MIVLIDNYDSFTYNLVQYIGGLGYNCDVIRNDQKSVDDILAQSPSHIVISPGPSDPEHAGICLDLIRKCEEVSVPLFGVCLGHQSIGQAFGGNVIRAPQPMHGKISPVFHDSKSVFRGIPTPFEVTRYHSLIVERDTLPPCLEVTAWTNDGLIMGLQHKNKPIHGVQFHPESIATENGLDLLRNFFTMA